MSAETPVTMQQIAQPATSSMTSDSPLMQISSALGGILLLILVVGWLIRRLGFAPSGRQAGLLKLRASCQVGQRERVVLVEVADTLLVLGVTAQQITPLHTLPVPPGESHPSDGDTTSHFRQLMRHVVQRQEKSA
ncbi:flagellar biosynthetic protein FliO [Enterobacteriaceae bacterium ESL0689]|nr:flagellar biosynthetic protein FliO [Enterobacteriaceae bacterium ESL0689]